MSEQLSRIQREVGEPITTPPDLAYEPDILAELREAMRLCGLVGEEKAAQIIYLALTSRVLDKPISVGVKGHSASGKSYTVGRVVDFFPKDAIVEFTGMSEKALIYRDEEYQHRTLIVYEVTGLREGNEDDLTSYFIRTLLSEGRINYEVTVRGKDGQFTTQRITKEGPTNLIFTTTKTQVHGENETRILSVNTDDGTEQTRRVLSALADETWHEVNRDQWRDLQSWIQKAEHRVTIPFAQRLADLVPPLAVRLRRDFAAVLALIRSHAILHQQSRERDEAGQVIATLEDYTAIRDLVAEVVSEGIGATVSDTVRHTVQTVAELSRDRGCSRAEVQKRLKIDQSNASRRLRSAADGGYIRNLEEKRGQPGRWVVGDPLPETVQVLPEPESLYLPEASAYPHTTVDNGNGATHSAYPDTSETRTMPSLCAYAAVQEGREESDGDQCTETDARMSCRRCDDEGCDWCGESRSAPKRV